MKRKLRAFFCTCVFGLAICGAAHAQIKGNPQLKGAKPLSIDKTQKASKLSSDLRNLYNDVTNPSTARAKKSPARDSLYQMMQVRGDKIVVDITINGDAETARAELEKAGAEITGIYGRMISAIVPIRALPQLEKTASLRFVRPAYSRVHGTIRPHNFTPQTQAAAATPVISQGDTAQRSYLARKNAKVNGDGVKVGILSNSYNILRTADEGVIHGELPGTGNPFGFIKPVQVLQDGLPRDTDEGRGMAEIVHDVAPGAALAFATGNGGQAAYALNILELADSGCNVIVDDLAYLAEPYFQDGIVAQATDRVKQRGVTYFSAAMNQGVRSYESNYRKSNYAPFGEVSGTAHNFSAPGDAPVYFQPIYIPTGGRFFPILQWDDPSFSAGGAGAKSDLDIYLLDVDSSIVAASIEDNINVSGDPVEGFDFFNLTNSDTFYLLILKFAGPHPKRLKYINWGFGSDFYSTTPAIPGLYAPTLFGHAKADGAIAVAAAPWFWTPAYGVDTPRVEGFSSVGGVANYFDKEGNRIKPLVRQKPEITAPDGGNTFSFPPPQLFGNQDLTEDRDTFPNFFGTSAAAPHAAGVAALMIEAQKLKTLTPNQIEGILMASAVDMDAPRTTGFDKGFDYNTGAGFIRADAAVAAVQYPNIYIKDLRLETVCSDDPATVRQWQIYNPNPFSVFVNWYLVGSSQYGTVKAKGRTKTTFTTQTVSYDNYSIPNVVVINWQDNLGTPQFDSEVSTSANCNSVVLTETKPNGGVALKEQMAGLNKAEVYPNPSTGNFKLMLSSANPVNTDIELYGSDGKLLLKKKAHTNGTFDINATNYNPGIYLLRVQQGGFTKTFRLTKQ